MSAIFLLERSERTELKELSPKEARRALLAHACIPRDEKAVMAALLLMDTICSKTRVFRFLSEPSAASVDAALEKAGMLPFCPGQVS